LDAVQAIKGPGFKPPTAMKGIAELVEHYKASTKGALAPKAVPKMPKLAVKVAGLAVPAVSELCKGADKASSAEFPGGEREALKRLTWALSDKGYVATFQKPQTSSTATRLRASSRAATCGRTGPRAATCSSACCWTRTGR
jgi:hypothetical protein